MRPIPGGVQTVTVMLAADRQQYNATSPVYLVFAFEGLPTADADWWNARTATVRLRAVREGTVFPVYEQANVPPRRLLSLALPGQAGELRPGDILQVGIG